MSRVALPMRKIERAQGKCSTSEIKILVRFTPNRGVDTNSPWMGGREMWGLLKIIALQLLAFVAYKP